MLTRATAVKAVLALCVANTLLYLYLRPDHIPTLATLGSLSASVGLGGACAGWEPGAAVDPPGCLRAKQFHEFQALHASGIARSYETSTRQALLAAERCVGGVTECPERPLILIDFYYWWRSNRDMWGPGETVWGWTVIDAMRAAGYIPIFFNGREEKGFMQTWELARALPSSVHAYVTDANAAVRCLLDPRCVRPEDYVPNSNSSLRFPDPPADETGVLPAWRVFGASFWGARPNKYRGTQQNPCGDWGQCDDADWDFHPLGNKWVWTPFAYPNGHTEVPMSMEQACLDTPRTPRAERDEADAVLVLAKLPLYFHIREFKGAVNALGRIRDAIAPTKLWTTVGDNGIKENPLPEALTPLGSQKPEAYAGLLGRAKALLGVGFPVISPTPYEALCRAVPVVLPYTASPTPEPGTWDMYYGYSFQHGPLMAVGEPYVYSYDVDNADDMEDKLQKALRTPIEPYIPPEMKTAAVHARVREILAHDWEGEYNRVLRANGGRMPVYPDEMIDKCFHHNHLAPCSGKYLMP